MKAVFWDLDDTVLDTIAGRRRALADTYEEVLGERPDADELWKLHLGASIEGLAQELMDKDWPRFVDNFRERYYGNISPLEPFPGVVATLDALRSDGLELAIVTSKISWGAKGELERAGLMDRFATVVGYDDCERSKPAPDPLLLAMRRMNLEIPGQIAYVGDAPSDMRAARAAGCQAIGAAWGSLDLPRLRAENPDLLAERPREVLTYVRARTGPGPKSEP